MTALNALRGLGSVGGLLAGLAACGKAGTAAPPPTNGPQRLLVLIVAAGCAASSRRDFAEQVAAVRKGIEQAAISGRWQLVTLGVALDHGVGDGLVMLRRFGRFDQVMVGSGWLNEGGVRYIWRDFAGEPVLPQMLLIEREVTVGDGRLRFGSDRLVARAVGAAEVARWAARLGRSPTAAELP